MADVKQIKVIVGSVTDRQSVIVSNDTTLRDTFKKASIDYAGATIQVDGVNIGLGDLDKSYIDLGITGDEAMLIAVVKADNA